MKNMTNLISYLKSTLHINVNMSSDKVEYSKPIPIAIKNNYDIFNIQVNNQNTVLLSTNEKDIGSVKKHFNLFENSLSIPVVLHIESISNSTKKYLIENAIPFVSEESIYLPQLLIYFGKLKETYTKVKGKKLSKLAQIILIYFITKKEYKTTINSSAELFAVTKMSTSRALNELLAFNYLQVENQGRTKEYFLKQDIEIETLLRDLKNPIMDTVFIKHQDLNYFHKKVKSSYSALSKYSNIINNVPIYAIEKEYFNELIKKNNSIIIYDKAYDNDLIQIELWRYNPIIIDENMIDPISLYKSLENNIDAYDTRTNDAMDELKNKIQGMLN